MEKDVLGSGIYRFKYTLLFVVTFFFWLSIFYCVPLTGDDKYFWMLQLKDAKSIFNYASSYGNGRLLGNIGVLYLVGNIHLRAVVKAACFSLMTLILPAVLQIKNFICYVLSFMLFICVAPGILAQTGSWTSGFQNYVPPVLLFLVGVFCVQKTSGNSKIIRAFCCVFSFVCGVCMQLYVEHSSCINLMLAFILMVYCIRADKRCTTGSILLFIGTALGLLLMFMIPKWFCTDTSFVDNYRKFVLFEGLYPIIYCAVKNAVKLIGMYSENTMVLLVLTATQSAILIKIANNLRHRIYIGGMCVPTAILFVCHSGSLIQYYGKVALVESVLLVLLMGVFCCSFILSAVEVLRNIKNKKIFTAYFLVFMSILSIAPFLLIEPIGYRSLIHSYVFLVGANILLLDEVLNGFDLKRYGYAKKFICLLTAMAMLFLVALFADINRMHSIRESHVVEQINAGQEKIDYFMIPSDYI